MRNVLAVSAVAEAATGVVLATYPGMFVRLLLGADLSGAGIALGRLAGFALIALGLACWPRGHTTTGPGTEFWAMLTYSFLAAVYLLVLGFGGALGGALLWPAAAAHAVLTSLLACAWFRRLA